MLGRGNYNPQHNRDLLKLAIEERDANSRPGGVPSGMAMNAYLASMPMTTEQQGEDDTINAMDKRADQGLDDQRAQAQDVTTSRELTSGQDPRRARELSVLGDTLKKVGEPARVAGEYDSDITNSTNASLERRQSKENDLTRELVKGGMTPGANGIPRSSVGSKQPVSRVSTNKALQQAVKDASSGSTSSAGILGILSSIIPGMKSQTGMDVPPDKMNGVITQYQNVMRENGIPDDVQEAAIALTQKYPGHSVEEKIKALDEAGYDSSQLDENDIANLTRALRMTGGM